MKKINYQAIKHLCVFALLIFFILALALGGMSWYTVRFIHLKERIDNRFTNFPIQKIDDGLKQVFGAYHEMFGSEQVIVNDVITLTDGRRVLVEEDISPAFYARADVIIEISKQVQSMGIPFLFVRAPNGIRDISQIPYLLKDDVTIIEDTELFVSILGENGVDVLDLRGEMIKDNIDFSKIYFWGDHHWNAYGALYAYGKIGELMNSRYGFDIDEKTWDPAEYEAVTYKESFIGSASARIDDAREDVTALIPGFKTDIEVKKINPLNIDEHMKPIKSGDFRDVFLPKTKDSSVVEFGYEDLYSMPAYFNRYINRAAQEDKQIMLVADSSGFSLTYFATGLVIVDHMYTRSETGPMMYPMLAQEHYDMVIFLICDTIIMSDGDNLEAGRFNFRHP